jgi:probable blue pigment (indigoidine) exporter
MMSMKAHAETGVWTAGATVLAPISWGTSYLTITELLPDGRPLLVATMRVVPSGLVLLAAGAVASRWRPRGAEWWRTGVLALFNFGIFFPLLVAAVYRLPGGVAAAVGGLQPLLVAALTRLVTGRRPRVLDLAVGSVAAVGVGLVVIHPGAGLDPVGVLAAVGANLSFAVGVVLTRRFPAPSNRLAATGWQLLLGGVILVPLTAVLEGAPPSLTGRNVAGFAYLSLVATALAFVLWFNGIRRLPVAAPPLLGLAAPVTGAVLGWVALSQSLSPLQLTGFVVTLAAIAYGASLGASGGGIVEDEPHGVASSAEDGADAVAHRAAGPASLAAHRAIAGGEHQPVAAGDRGGRRTGLCAGPSRQARLPDGDAQASGREADLRRRGRRVHPGHPVVDAAVRAAEDQQISAAQLDVGERAGPAVDACQAEDARVAEADRHDGGGRGFLPVLVQAEAGGRGVEVQDDGVGGVGGRLRP